MATLTPGELLGVPMKTMPSCRRKFLRFSPPTAPPPRWALKQAATGLPATKTWSTFGMKMTAENRLGRTYFPPGDVKHDGTAVGLRWRIGWPNPPPLSAINEIVRNHVPYIAVPQAAAPRRNRGDRQLHSLQRKIEVALSPMIESQEDASATPTVLAAAMLRSAWEDINDIRTRSYAGNQSDKLDPRNDFDKPRPLPPGK